jgi:hypothetical protein
MGFRIGLGGSIGPFRGGISNRGLGLGVGRLSVGFGRSRRPRNGGCAVFVGQLCLLVFAAAWPYWLGSWAAGRFGAGAHSSIRNVVGWVFEAPYLSGLLLAALAALLSSKALRALSRAVILISVLLCLLTGASAHAFGSSPATARLAYLNPINHGASVSLSE